MNGNTGGRKTFRRWEWATVRWRTLWWNRGFEGAGALAMKRSKWYGRKQWI